MSIIDKTTPPPPMELEAIRAACSSEKPVSVDNNLGSNFGVVTMIISDKQRVANPIAIFFRGLSNEKKSRAQKTASRVGITNT
ncbi:hypothetical protein GCM10009087_20610 [Sphingomonas oligophenolica]